MVGMLKNSKDLPSFPAVQALARFLHDASAQDPIVLDISERSSFADFFVIAGATSLGHLRGLVRNIDDFLSERGIHARGSKKNLADDDSWVLLDCADFIVHIMLKPARDFYAIEKLWHESPQIDPETGLEIA